MSSMRVIAKRTLREFWERHPDSQGPLEAWHDAFRRREWNNWTELKEYFQRSFDPVGNDRYAFNIKGNTYRLIVKIDFPSRLALVKFIGTHAEYDRINAKEVEP